MYAPQLKMGLGTENYDTGDIMRRPRPGRGHARAFESSPSENSPHTIFRRRRAVGAPPIRRPSWVNSRGKRRLSAALSVAQPRSRSPEEREGRTLVKERKNAVNE